MALTRRNLSESILATSLRTVSGIYNAHGNNVRLARTFFNYIFDMHMTSNFFCVSTPPKVCYSSSPAGWRGPPGLWQSEPYSGRLELQKRDGASWNNFQINVHCLSFLHVLNAEYKSFFVFFLMYCKVQLQLKAQTRRFSSTAVIFCLLKTVCCILDSC